MGMEKDGFSFMTKINLINFIQAEHQFIKINLILQKNKNI